MAGEVCVYLSRSCLRVVSSFSASRLASSAWVNARRSLLHPSEPHTYSHMEISAQSRCPQSHISTAFRRPSLPSPRAISPLLVPALLCGLLCLLRMLLGEFGAVLQCLHLALQLRTGHEQALEGMTRLLLLLARTPHLVTARRRLCTRHHRALEQGSAA